ncbi:MFS transporter [Streptomyces sp. NPDC001667]
MSSNAMGSSAAGRVPPPSPSVSSASHPRAALVVLCTGMFLIGLDVTVMNVTLPSLQAELRPDMTGLRWVAEGYTLTLACGVLAAGLWADAHGRRRSFLLGLALCGVASASGAVAGETGQVIAARCTMGVGAALLMPATLSLITVLFPDPQARRRAIAVWTLVAGTGALAGPVVGGVLVEASSWRAGFWVNVPVAALGIAGALSWVPESRNPRAKQADHLSLAIASTGLLALVWAIIEAPARGWSNGPVLLSFGVAGLLLAWLLVRAQRGRFGLLPAGRWSRRRFAAGAIALAWMFFALFGVLFLLTLYLQTVLGYTPLQAGWRLLPLAAAIGAGAGLSVLLARRWEDTSRVVGGMLLACVGFLLLAFTPDGSGCQPVLYSLVVTGIGVGLAAAPATETVMSAVPPQHAGADAAVNDLAREVDGVPRTTRTGMPRSESQPVSC